MKDLENCEKSIEEISEKVKFNVFAESKNYRKDIGVGVGNLIVLGYENNGLWTKECAFIGEYIDGDIHFVTTRNNLTLRNSDNPEVEFVMDKEESTADAMVWWRVPTDDEVKVYYHYYKHLGLKKEIERVLSNHEYGWDIRKDELLELLNDIKEVL